MNEVLGTMEGDIFFKRSNVSSYNQEDRIMSVGDEGKVILCPVSSLKEKTFDRSEFSASRNLNFCIRGSPPRFFFFFYNTLHYHSGTQRETSYNNVSHSPIAITEDLVSGGRRESLATFYANLIVPLCSYTLEGPVGRMRHPG